jgi:hypothetical protein
MFLSSVRGTRNCPQLRYVLRHHLFRLNAPTVLPQLLGVLPARFWLRIHGYVLTGNHYHPLVETTKANLSKAVQ